MEKATRRLASSIAQSLGYDREREAVIAYGLFAVVQVALTVVLTLLFGLLVSAPVEALIVCFSVSLYRKFSGGAHASSAGVCLVVTVAVCTVAALAAKWLAPMVDPPWLLVAIAIAYGLTYWITCRYAPVDSPNKPIKTVQKIKRMRKGSLITVTVYLALQLLLFGLGYGKQTFTGYGLSLLLGVAWQAFTLTPLGSILLARRDVLPKSSGKEVSK